ncbi:unnamed protein product [Cladocopium goreaui]|uniref:Nuclear cap-binding protein subunit 2-A n=1 Tax=Cladocopium goreaui TaxID=2562237 RepID=A0A9P1BTK1_9DINO|nr:unnamed protein product [Cladocopium goreaui]
MAASFRSRRSVHRALAMVILMFGALAATLSFAGPESAGFGRSPSRSGKKERCEPSVRSFAAKAELLEAIHTFQEELNRTSNLSIDFGVKGGELDEKDRAPSNLAASGAFARASVRLGQAADEVLQKVERLKGGCPEPLKGFGTPQGAECPLHGSWRLRFTTAADATFTRNSTRGTAKVSNVVDAVSGSVTNCIDFDHPDAAECLRVRLSAETESKTRLGLAFRYVKVRLTKFFGFSLGQRRLTLTLPVPGPFLTRIITFFTRKTPPKPFFEIIYLDDDLRVHKTGQGNVFVQEKMSVPPPYL